MVGKIFSDWAQSQQNEHPLNCTNTVKITASCLSPGGPELSLGLKMFWWTCSWLHSWTVMQVSTFGDTELCQGKGQLWDLLMMSSSPQPSFSSHEETSPESDVPPSQLSCCSKCSAVELLLETSTLLMMPWGSGTRGQVSGWKVKLLTALITWPVLSEVLQRSGLSCVYSDRCSFTQSLVLHEVKYSMYNHYIYLNINVPCKYLVRNK